MFYGRITDDLGNRLTELGPYTYINDLYADLMHDVPDWFWQPEYELSIWMEKVSK